MRTQCPTCGQWLELPARAATCPNCGTLVTIPVSATPSRVKSPLPEPAVQYERPAPYEPPPGEMVPPWLRAILIIGVCAILAFSLIFFVIWKVTQRMNAPVATAPPPIVKPVPQSPPTAPKSIFSEEPASTTPPPPPQSSADETTAPPEPTPPTLPPLPTTAPMIHPTTAPIAGVKPQAIEITDEAVNTAILRGAEALMSHFENGKLKGSPTDERYPGTDALCVLALLHAGQAIADERLNVHNPFMSSALDQLRTLPMPQSVVTYTRSIRAQALAIYNRKEDRGVLEADTRWLLSNHVRGCYTYNTPTAGATQPSQAAWDNSNSQYGVLGVWAASDAGIPVPLSYWQEVQSHWEQSQCKNGGWDYGNGAGNSGTLSMTAAGVNMLFVANEMISAQRPEAQVARPPFSPTLQAGLDWLGTGDNAVTLTGGYPTYTLYGMERAGLACGFKMFGTHDWYRELAADALAKQNPDGSWGGDVETAFTMLFLSRGRHPLLMNKLHFVGAWANRPRDVAHLAKFTGHETERALNWQVVSLSNPYTDWLDAPILYLASHEAPVMDENDYAKLRAFVAAGGMLLTQADGDSKEFNQFVEQLAMVLFNGQELKELPESHYVYNVLFKPKEKFPLKAVTTATRVLMLHSPVDIARRWQTRDGKSDRPAFELGANLFVYATGMAVPRNRLETLAVPEVAGKATMTVPIARLKYPGDWDPEPYAWQRMAKMFRHDTNVELQVIAVEIEKLSTAVAPFAHLTGTSAFSLSDPQIAALRKYVDDGGVLLIDPCGGFTPVVRSIHENILKRAFPDKKADVIKPDHILVTGLGQGMRNLVKPQPRPFVYSVMGNKFTRPALLNAGHGVILVSDLDITSGLLGTSTYGIAGYEPHYASNFVNNAILWTFNGRAGAPQWSTTQPATQP